MPAKKTNSTTKQVRKQVKTLKNGNPINTAAQFGKPNGNPRHNGAWKKEDTPRYKLERLITLEYDELMSIKNDEKASVFERTVADILTRNYVDPTEKSADRLRALTEIINQVYGFPKQSVETVDLTPPPALSPRKRKKNKR